jgi:hypothetical protein
MTRVWSPEAMLGDERLTDLLDEITTRLIYLHPPTECRVIKLSQI